MTDTLVRDGIVTALLSGRARQDITDIGRRLLDGTDFEAGPRKLARYHGWKLSVEIPPFCAQYWLTEDCIHARWDSEEMYNVYVYAGICTWALNRVAHTRQDLILMISELAMPARTVGTEECVHVPRWFYEARVAGIRGSGVKLIRA